MKTDLEKLKDCYLDLEVDFVVRNNGEYSYLFVGKPEDAQGIQWMDDNFETTELDALTLRNKYFEFENGELVSLS